ncbi:MAG: VCBS repeat-containing protein [Hymenobacteraceae bacterium]|nr:VCBS repeat-containing protein [Hymenobacteraceae bacterium]
MISRSWTARAGGWLRQAAVGAAVLLGGVPFAARAQQRYGLELTDHIPVVVGTDTLRQPWVGGFNSASYSKIDLNADGVDDLYVHDQTAQRHLTFIATNSANGWYWRHEPAYESAFPDDAGLFYVTLRDYDGDGRPDLFAVRDQQFWGLYRNVGSPTGVGLSFQPVSFRLLLADNVSWLSTSIYGQQSVEDFDADGDPDILDFAYGSDFFTLYRNTGSVGGAEPRFAPETEWGGLLRCVGSGLSCHTYSFPGAACRPGQPTHGSRPDYALCAADVDGDGDRDLLIGQQYCRDLGLLVNQGSDAVAVFTPTSLRVPYPAGPPPATLVHTPAATYADVTFDGLPDLLVAPWLTGQEAMISPYSGDQYDTRHAAWLYRRTGPGATGFQFDYADFLQREMVEVGNQSAPALGDLDGDGDLDLLIGNQGDLVFTAPPVNSFASFRGKLAFYRNVGTPRRAIFRLESDDFSALSACDRRAFVPALTDLDGNGSLDLVLRSTNERYGGSFPSFPNRLGYILNRAPVGQLAVFPPDSLKFLRLQVPAGTSLDEIVWERMLPLFHDLDGDGDRDLLIGTAQAAGGAVQFFENRGGPLATAFRYNPAWLGNLPGDVSNPAPAVADIDGDGQPELLVGADDGELRAWPGVLAAPGGPVGAAGQGRLVCNGLTRTYGRAGLGTRLVLAAGDLDADGRAEILVGTAGGGIRLLRGQPDGLTGLANDATGHRGSALNVFPNPAASNCTVELLGPGGSTEKLLTLTLRDALGRCVWQAPAQGSKQTVALAEIAPGLYVLTATTTVGRIFAHRLSVVAP